MKPLILLTGVTGFIGNNLYTLNKKYNYRLVVRDAGSNSDDAPYVIASLGSETKWDGAFNNVESVIHLAGLAHSNIFTYRDYQSVNVEGTLKLAFEAAKAGVKRFVFVSSILVCDVENENENISVQTRSKYDAEIGLKKIAKKTGLELVIVRPTLVYGANAPGNVGLLIKLIQKLPFLPFGLTNNKRDFIAVQNLADLLLACSKHSDAAGHTFLASDGHSISIKTFTNAIANGLNKSLIQIPIPVSLMRLGSKLIGKSAMVEQLLGNLEIDSSNAQEILGWVPPFTMAQAMTSLSEIKK